MDINAKYQELLDRHGPQGWWPLLDVKGTNPTKTGSVRGYHPGDYSYPKDEGQRFEICIGAILTQNTAWPNVEKALRNLKRNRSIDPWKILSMSIDQLKDEIRPSGYYNQKARKIREFSEFYIELEGRTPTREELLAIWGIGEETADSILLYAYQVPKFVVDSYTKRVFGLDKKYSEIQKMFEEALPRDYRIYQEYHALIVEEAKNLES